MSRPGHEYTPTVTEDGWACQCAGWRYRLRCRHITAAQEGRYTGKPIVRLALPAQPVAPVTVDALYG